MARGAVKCPGLFYAMVVNYDRIFDSRNSLRFVRSCGQIESTRGYFHLDDRGETRLKALELHVSFVNKLQDIDLSHTNVPIVS